MDLSVLFNSRDYEAFHAKFDPLAKVQISQDELQAELNKLRELFGQIEASAYSHHEYSEGDGPSAYILYYQVRLSGGTFDQGTLRISIVDRGDHAGLFGFFIYVSTQ